VTAVLRFRIPAIAALIALVVVLWTPPEPGRVVAALYLSFVAPGLALAPVLGFRAETARFLTWWFLGGVIAISFSVSVLIAQAELYTVGFFWRPCAVALVCVTCAGSLFDPISSGGIQLRRVGRANQEDTASGD
jgi:hypothetical protein